MIHTHFPTLLRRAACLAAGLLAVCVLAVQAAGPAAASLSFIDAKALAGADEAAVARLVGSGPMGCQDRSGNRRCLYANGALDITFVGGRAEWIAFSPAGELFLPSSLAAVSLPTDVPPDTIDDAYLRWTNVAGLREVTMHRGAEGYLSFIYIVVSTLP